MSWVEGLLISFIVGSLILSLVSQYLFVRLRQLPTVIWTLAWALYSVYFGVDLGIRQVGVDPLLVALKTMLDVGGTALFAWGILVVASSQRNWLLGVLFAITALVSIWVTSQFPDPLVVALPGAVFVAIVYSTVAVVLWRTPNLSAGTRRYAAITVVLVGLTHPLLTTLSLDPQWVDLSYGMMACSGIALVSAVVAVYVSYTRRHLSQQTSRGRLLLEHAQDVVFVVRFEPTLAVEFLSPSCTKVTGYSPEQISRAPRFVLGRVDPADRTKIRDLFLERFESCDEGMVRFRSRADNLLWLEFRLIRVRGDDGRILRVEGILRDISARRELEEQLQRSQRLESLGRLAGGIAHDFNNLLGVIVGSAELGKEKLSHGKSPDEMLSRIIDAGERAAELTQKLLVFGKQTPMELRCFRWASLLQRFRPLVEPLLGDRIALMVREGADEPTVRADPSQMEQVLLNLVINARDAISGRGKIIMTSSTVVLDGDFCSENPGMVPGPYVRFDLEDDGEGMSDDTMRHVFEPFFTTKEDGTGLGLSSAHAIISRFNGTIKVRSRVGRGTCFSVFLPSVDDPPRELTSSVELLALPQRLDGPILLVDDEPDIVEMLQEYLREVGYEVLTAETSEHALRQASLSPRPPALLVTDVRLAETSGPRLARILKESYPKMGVLFMTGYSGALDTDETSELADHPILQKPFRREELLRAMHRVARQLGKD